MEFPEHPGMNTTAKFLLPFVLVMVTSCASHPQKTASHKKLELQTIDRGPMRPKTYLYREVDQPSNQ